MRKILLLSLTVISLSYFSPNTNAALLVEPYMGYNLAAKVGKGKKDDAHGSTIGGRLGYQSMGFMMGLNFNNTTLDVEKTDPDLKYTSYGIFVGYNFPVFIRVWGEYIFSGSGDFGSTKDIDTMGGTRLGVGFTALPFISVNLEMSKPTIDYKRGGAKDVEASSYLLSISLPLTF